METQETADISVAFDGFAGSATFPWTARNLRGSCSGTGATTCGPVPVSAGGSTPDASSTYSLDSYFGITPTYSVTHSLTCNSAGPISRGTASFSTVHYHVGTVSVQVQLGSVVSWSLTGPGGYVYAGAGTLTLDNVPYTGAAGEITVVGNPGTFICVSLSSISPGNCTAFSGGAGENFGVGGSYGLPVRLSVPILHHVTQPVYIYSQTAPTPAISLTVPSPSKLYQSSPSVTLTGGTPRAYVLTTIQKSGPGGTAEGNVDDCAGLTTLAPYNTTILTNSSGNYSGSLFVFGDAGPVLNQNAIGCWKLGIAVNNVPSSPSFLPAGGIKVYAGILAIKPVVNNGAKSGGVAVIEPMATRPTATWTYPTGLATENCGASPCTGFSIPAGSAGYVADPLKQSGSSAPNHDIVFPAVNLTPPYFPPYNNAAMLNWVNKCNDTSLTVSKKEAKQGMPATGCAAPDRGNLQYNWQLINTRIRVRATVNGGPFIGTPPGTTGGTSSGNGNGSVAFPTTPIPGRYTITGPDTRTGTTAEGLHWGVRY
ncbi:MAG: hypothetical protein Q7S09_01710 [bacterium]|nr:hypothetical protein [bacterium]